MKAKFFAVMVVAALGVSCAYAQSAPEAVNNQPAVFIKNEQMGSGAPAVQVTMGSSIAQYWGDGLYFIPGYYPGYPTAAVMWPRVIEVPCVKNDDGSLSCQGYEIYSQQAGNRGEFILFKPVIQAPAKPVAPTIVEIHNKCGCCEQKPLPVIKKKIRQ